MDNFLTRAVRKNPKPYAIIGLPMGLILGYCSFTGLIHNFIGGFIAGLFIGIGITAVQYWIEDKQRSR